MAAFVRHEPCPNCGSKDNLAIYADGSYFCFSHCGYKSVSEEWKSENSKDVKPKKEPMEIETKASKPAITEDDKARIKAETSVKCQGFRSLRDDITTMFGVRHSFDEGTGEVDGQYYPVTQEGQLVGYKIREVPKNFRSIGRTGADCELFMQFKFNRGGKYVLIVEGEVDALSGYQMLSDYNKSKGSDFETAVVSPTIGANSKKQIAAQYTFLDSFDNIILCMDNDAAGKKAADELVKHLPKGKVKLMQMRYKDPNEYLTAGKGKEFVSDFYNAKSYVPAGVLGSSELYDKMLEQASRASIPLPPFMKKLETMLGSFELQTCGVIAAGTGAAKTTLANEIIYYLIFNSPYKTGIVSLELDGGQYAQALLSRHISNRISSINDPDERVKYLKSEKIKEKSDELFKTEDGTDRFMVLDERDFSIEVMKEKIIEMIVCGGVQVIILDPVSDLFEGLPYETQSSFMQFLKSTMKNYPVSFLLLAHIRKSSDNKGAASSGAFVPEESIFGSGSLIKSASWVAMLSRDKYNTDDLVRNTTNIVLSKNRRGAVTGEAGKIYYDNATHRMYDLDDYVTEHGLVDF